MLFVAGKMITAQGDTKSMARKKCNNLICLFDPGQAETARSNIALALDFLDALNEKVAPIMLTTNLVENFCYWKTHRLEVMGRFLLQYPYFIKKLVGTDLAGWECYFHKRAGLVLLIPKKYIETHAMDKSSDRESPIVQCGFNPDNLHKINNVSPSTILEYINNHPPAYNKIIDDFESIFIKFAADLSPQLVWNVFMLGHGGPTLETKTKKVDESIIVKAIKQVEARIRAIKRGDVNEEDLTREEKKLTKLLRQLKQARSGGLLWQKKLSSGIAGLKDQDFIRLMDFFEHGIKTSYLHYETCFAGGSNLTLLNQELSLINVSFIVSTLGVNESVSPYSDKPMKFTAFFRKLEALMCDATDIVGDQESINALVKDAVASIVESVTNVSYLDYNQPFVRIPSVGIFKALDIADKVQLLTHSLAKVHEAEGTAIDYSDKSIVTLFVYPSYVAVPVKIKDHVAIASPAPQTLVGLEKPTIHVFEKMFYQDSLSSIIPNFVSFNTRYQRIIFVIKELHCLDGQYLKLGVGGNKPIEIKDLIIQIAPAESFQYHPRAYVDISIDVVFSYRGNDYSISRRVNRLQKNMDKLFDAFKNEKCEPVTSEQLAQLGEKIIGKSGIAQLTRENKEITLPSMVEYFEKTIDRSSKKIGVSKYTVLLKKTKQLERVTSQVALKMQKAFMVKTESLPGVAWMNRLERLGVNATKLLEYVNQRAEKDPDDATLVSCKARIEKIKTLLAQEYELANKQLSVQEREVINSAKLPGFVERFKSALSTVNDAVGKGVNAVRNQARKVYLRITGQNLDEEVRYGYGKRR